MKASLKCCFLIIMISLFLSQSLLGGIQLKMTKVSHTYPGGAGTNGILVVDVYFQNTEPEAPAFTGIENYYVFAFDFALSFGSALEDNLTGTPVITHQYFDNTYYLESATVSGAEIIFSYGFKGTAQSEMDTTDNQVWNKVATITFTHVWNGAAITSFSWLTGYGSFTGWDGSGFQDPDVTYQSVPSDLQDISLPVEMSEMLTEFTYEFGVELQWTTQSEVNLEGFQVLRSEQPDGPYIRINDHLIAGQGNSSISQQYSFTDSDVDYGKTYYYKLLEQSTTFGDTSKTFFGPISAMTGDAPTRFSLSRNFPNPFNPATEMQFEITEGGPVDLSVYNLIGQKVATLVSGIKPAGIYTVQWQGINDTGQDVPSGVYLYRLTAPEGIHVQKMMKIE